MSAKPVKQGFAASQRGRLTRFQLRHQLAWDSAMGVLTVIYVFLTFRQDSASGIEANAIWALAIFFLIEFSARCYDSLDRGQYLYSHWLDLITAVPVPGIPGLRIIRLLRLLRLMKVGMLIRRRLLGRGWDASGLIWPTLVIFWVLSASALWLVEHDAPGSSIVAFQDAMTASFLTAATLGFGRHTLPVTQDGQIIAAMIVFFALGLWGFASGNLTRLLLNAKVDSVSTETDNIRHELESIGEQIKGLTNAVNQLRGSGAPVKEPGDVEATDEPQFRFR